MANLIKDCTTIEYEDIIRIEAKWIEVLEKIKEKNKPIKILIIGEYPQSWKKFIYNPKFEKSHPLDEEHINSQIITVDLFPKRKRGNRNEIRKNLKKYIETKVNLIKIACIRFQHPPKVVFAYHGLINKRNIFAPYTMELLTDGSFKTICSYRSFIPQFKTRIDRIENPKKRDLFIPLYPSA